MSVFGKGLVSCVCQSASLRLPPPPPRMTQRMRVCVCIMRMRVFVGRGGEVVRWGATVVTVLVLIDSAGRCRGSAAWQRTDSQQKMYGAAISFSRRYILRKLLCKVGKLTFRVWFVEIMADQ